MKVFNAFRCVLDVNSLPRYPVTQNYHKGDFIVARVVFVDPSSKSIRLCAKAHVVRLKLPSALPALGEFLVNLEVVRIHKKTGIYLRTVEPIPVIDETSDSMPPTSSRPSELLTFIHKSKLSSSQEELEDKSSDHPIADERITSTYRVGDVVQKVRILGYHLVEGIAVATNLQHHIDEDSITHWSHLHVGELHTAVVVSIKEAGLNLKIGDKVNAFCPTQHLSDTTASRNKAVSTSFKVGQKVKIRIWQVKPDGSIIATHKKSLIEEVHDNIFSYDDVVIGKVAIGVISHVSDSGGVVVHFYNGIKGSIPVNILLKQGVSNIPDAYRPGQTLKCVTLAKFRATDVNKLSAGQERRGQHQQLQDVVILALLLGNASDITNDLAADVKQLYAGVTNLLIKEEDRTEHDNMMSTPIVVSSSGSFVSGSISKVEESLIKVALDDGRIGILHKHQCFDFAETGDYVFNDKELVNSILGARIGNALVLDDAKGKNVLISVKPLLCQAKGSVPSFPLHLSTTTKGSEEPMDSLLLPAVPSDVHPGQVVVGFVHKVEEFGVLVKFLKGMIALIPLPNIGDKFVSDATNLFTIGDSIRCVVQRVDLEHDKVILTCKSLLVSPSGGSLCYLQAYLSQVLATRYTNSDFSLRVNNLKVGSVIQGVLSKK